MILSEFENDPDSLSRIDQLVGSNFEGNHLIVAKRILFDTVFARQ